MTAMIRCGEQELTQEQLLTDAARQASGLAALGVKAGDRVAIVVRNEPAFVSVSFAVRMLGAVPVPANWHWKGAELAFLLKDSESRVAVAHADLLETVEHAAPEDAVIIEAPVPDAVARGTRLSAEDTQPSGRHRDLAWLTDHDPWTTPPPGSTSSMIYTSGTTGNPKGVLREPADPEQEAEVNKLLGFGLSLAPGMTTLVPAPLYHSAPNVHALVAVRLGCDLTLMPRFDPEELLRLIERHRVEHVQMVPTMFHRLLALPEAVRERYDISSLRAVVHAAAPCPPEEKRAMIEWWGPIITEYYGGTETGIVVHATSEQWLAHPGTVGAPVADAAVRIVGADGAELPAGETGEIYLRPPSAWPQFTYLGRPEARAEMERDGFLTLGDVGHVDGDGFLWVTDRVKDMVIAGGVNIYPVEIEQCLLGLKGVRDAAVIGVPDPDLGEALAAHIELLDGAVLSEDEVRDHVRRELAAYKVPRLVVFEEALPREDSGKLFKRRLRERYQAA
ncbi:MAG TPA: AMP-binding protein [Solirubrobacteraceae bacterium]|jgi:long-chain acyl-CoA synthetase|nr:AMP-binding protein [Solirubrobacteraceae bacterium]